MRIAYILYGEATSPVVKSQTFGLFRELTRRGAEVHLVAVLSSRRFLERKRYATALAEAAEACGGRLVVLTHPPRHAPETYVAWRVRGVLRRIRPDVVHARQSRAAVPALSAGFPVLLDLRGIRPEEHDLSAAGPDGALAPRDRRIVANLRDLDRRALAGAAAVVCVSAPFRVRLGGEERIHVIPNAADPIPAPDPSARRAGRADLGIADDERAFVYSGSLAAWQGGPHAVRLFREIRARSPAARLVLLTHDAAAGRALVEGEGVHGAVVRSLTPEAARTALTFGDAALLVRERHPVNEVAAPVKFAEYLHAGLPVILTEGIGDASATVRREGLGVVLPSPDDPGNAERVLAGLPAVSGERCREYARRELTFERTAALYHDAYEDAIRRAAAKGVA